MAMPVPTQAIDVMSWHWWHWWNSDNRI